MRTLTSKFPEAKPPALTSCQHLTSPFQSKTMSPSFTSQHPICCDRLVDTKGGTGFIVPVPKVKLRYRRFPCISTTTCRAMLTRMANDSCFSESRLFERCPSSDPVLPSASGSRRLQFAGSNSRRDSIELQSWTWKGIASEIANV